MNTLPLFQRGPRWQGIRQAAAAGRLALQFCTACGQAQYPPREICRQCLADALCWRRVRGAGGVNAWTRLHASAKDFFYSQRPWAVANITLDCGPILYAFSSDDCLRAGARVCVHAVIASNADVLFIATSPAGAAATDFAQFNQLTGGKVDE